MFVWFNFLGKLYSENNNDNKKVIYDGSFKNGKYHGIGFKNVIGIIPI